MISLPTKPKIVKKQGNRAIFQIEGLFPGYGITIGNTLRRVLLSSLEGAAIVQVKIKGAPHEFSTISGILEDAVVILMNLKKVRFKLFTDEPQTAVLSVKGVKEATAKDFKLSSQTKIANPELHIASLTKASASLNIEAVIEKGTGYQPSEMRQSGKSAVGALPLDAIFTPIVNVSLKVENMRVGKRTDFDRLILEVETDGTILPEKAMAEAIEILRKHYDILAKEFPKEEKEEKAAEKKTTKKASKKKPAKKTTPKK